MIEIIAVNAFPSLPGVYLMRGENKEILYVGKARDLKQRVRSYFRSTGDSRYHIRFLMAKVAEIDYIVTDTEKEALILENTLIKEHRPRYNFNLKDDKTYFSLRMDMKEEYPRLSIVRKVPRDGARYFGPYSSASAAREVIKELSKIFPLRHYPMETCRRRNRPCLFHQIHQCSAPCFNLISREEYGSLAEGTALFLEGKNRELLQILTRKMGEAAGAERYEQAARYRDLIASIRITVEKQKMVTQGGDTDVFGIFQDGGKLEIVVMFVRRGMITGSRSFSLTWELDEAEGLSSFLNQYYSGEVFIPREILLPLQLPEQGGLAELLSEQRGGRVSVHFPKRGTKSELVELANRNAATASREKEAAEAGMETVLKELQERLHLPVPPVRMECYDISNIGGRHGVGSRVTFVDGRPEKSRYRRYRIRTVDQQDDFAMMHEVLSRRFRDGDGSDPPPDLIIVDGGPGQLNVLVRILGELGISGPAAVSLAKSRVEKDMAGKEVQRSNERVFLPGRKNPVVLRQNSRALLLLARIRDEAHRFAVTYHKKLRGKGAIASFLEEIPGVGAKRRKELLRHFGSLKRLQEASVEQIAEVPGMTKAVAEKVFAGTRENPSPRDA